MSEPGSGATDDEVGVVVDIDYDDRRWLQLPATDGSIDLDVWAQRWAQAWAQDCGRSEDARWAQVLTLMLRRCTAQTYSSTPVEVMLRVRAPAGQAPMVDPAPLVLSPCQIGSSIETEAAGIVAALATDAVEPPTQEPVALGEGVDGIVIAAHQRDADNSIRTVVCVLWKPADEVSATYQMGSYEIGDTLSMAPDLIELARVTTVRVGTEQQLRREAR